MLQKAKKVTPSSCRQADRFFTQMGIISNVSSNIDLLSEHIDKGDLIAILFHIGQWLHEGRTDYYIGLTNDEYGILSKHIPCQYGRLTIGCFDKIIQSPEAWEGSRGCINLNVKKNT